MNSLQKELGGSDQALFCYPHGRYNDTTVKILKELNIKKAFTVEAGINNSRVSDLELKRIEISGIDSMFDFRKKLTGAFDWLLYQERHNVKMKKYFQSILMYR